eukprot:1161920-Pelagomonas_calceolata.AAC.1
MHLGLLDGRGETEQLTVAGHAYSLKDSSALSQDPVVKSEEAVAGCQGDGQNDDDQQDTTQCVQVRQHTP